MAIEVVSVDTQILSWAIIGKSVKGSEPFIPLARDFMGWLDKQNVTILVPTIVISEMLVSVDPIDIPTVMKKFKSDWVTIDFDFVSAVKYAAIRRDHIINKRYDDIRKIYPDCTKRELDADTKIIANAIAHGATTIYSEDARFLSVAEGYINARHMQDESFQLTMDLDDNTDS